MMTLMYDKGKKSALFKEKKNQFQTNWYKMFVSLRALNLRLIEQGMIKLQGPMELLLSNSWNKPELE